MSATFIGINEGRHIHRGDGHDEFVRFAKRNDRNAIFIKRICDMEGCDDPRVLVGVATRFKNSPNGYVVILVTEESAQNNSELFPQIIHFFYEDEKLAD